MDTTKAITHVSLCAGYGGIDLGLSRAIPTLPDGTWLELKAHGLNQDKPKKVKA